MVVIVLRRKNVQQCSCCNFLLFHHGCCYNCTCCISCYCYCHQSPQLSSLALSSDTSLARELIKRHCWLERFHGVRTLTAAAARTRQPPSSSYGALAIICSTFYNTALPATAGARRILTACALIYSVWQLLVWDHQPCASFTSSILYYTAAVVAVAAAVNNSERKKSWLNVARTCSCVHMCMCACVRVYRLVRSLAVK